MKVLVAVASKHGSTREIAQVIAAQLRAAHLDADLREAGEVPDLGGYDAVVLGSAVYVGSWLPEARHFAERHRAALAKLPVWIFSSGPLGALDPRPQDDPERLAAPMAGVEVRDHRVFVGKLDPAGLGLGERLAVKMVRAPKGDFRDWAAIRGWAREIAAALRSDAVPAGAQPDRTAAAAAGPS